ncbi:IS3 family transposase [Ancylobacter sonchi]|nr:IS3 family transposase [Ancylobacter sonchi]
MIAFIDNHRGAYGVEPIYKVSIAPSTYHERLAQRHDRTRLSIRARSDQALKPEIARVFAQNFAVYGMRKLWRHMRREGFEVARYTAAPRKGELGLQGVIGAAGAHHDQRPGLALSARPRQPPVPRPGARSAVAVGFHLRRHLDGVCRSSSFRC